MASRELNILITAKNLAGPVLSGVKGELKGIQSEAKRGAQNVVRNVGIAAVAAGALVATQVRAGLESLARLEVVNAQTAAVLESTNNAAGVSAQNVRTWAEELEKLTAVDDKAIQNTENLLLTFTSVDKKAFKPALETILDMNAAMGGDEESLQGVAIQVGKALQDPIRGITALRRVGVNFNETQLKQIKALVEANDLYGAQKMILTELNKEFGGSAAAQANTYAGKMRLVADAVEDAQMALATAFLPVLLKVGDKLQTFLSDPKTLASIADLGETLAGGLDDAIDIVGKLPWDAIGSTFKLLGQGAKVVLDMFLSMPPWVQTAVLTGWGLNKLTGGALGNIVGSLASGLIKGVLGINAGVVNINAGVVNGGPGGVPVGGPGGNKPGLPWWSFLFGGAALAGLSVKQAEGAEQAKQEGRPALPWDWLIGSPFKAAVKPLERDIHAVKETGSRSAGHQRQQLSATLASLGVLGRIAAKQTVFSPTIVANVTANVSVNDVLRRTQTVRIAGQNSIGGFLERDF